MRGGGGRHYGGGRYHGGGRYAYGGGKRYSGKHYNHSRYYRRGHGWGYWRGGVWIATGIVGYGGSYCSRLYYYDYNRWLYECQ
jgi:hypothetical protein